MVSKWVLGSCRASQDDVRSFSEPQMVQSSLAVGCARGCLSAGLSLLGWQMVRIVFIGLLA